MKIHLEELKQREKEVKAHPDKQISETDPDSRLMKLSTVGSMVAYNVQNAVDTDYKLIVGHEVTNSPVDRGQLLPIAQLVKGVIKRDEFTVLADRGYYKGEDIRSCILDGITTLVPKSLTSGNGAAGKYPRAAFKYDKENDAYRCPAGEILQRRHSTVEKETGKTMIVYYASIPVCRACVHKDRCTVGVNRRVQRWEHEDVLDGMADDLAAMPDAMTVRAQTVEHPFGTIKLWMGARHFLMKGLDNVRTEMSLHVLAYNMHRMISIFGVTQLMAMLEWLSLHLLMPIRAFVVRYAGPYKKRVSLTGIDLSEATHGSEVYLYEVDLSDADLSAANLSGAYLVKAIFQCIAVIQQTLNISPIFFDPPVNR